ncbi:MAG: cell division protein FtsA [Prolixibacteraceae bacterium]|nr:cell division protein FtsA [Prolixibacteraceae bacterium]
MKRGNKIVAAIDVGTTKIVAVAGEKREDGTIEILGYGKACARGIKRGVVFNIREAGESVREAVDQVEKTVGKKINEVYVNVIGRELKTITKKTQKHFDEDRLITKEDIKELYCQIKETTIPKGYKVYHIEPQLYQIGDETGISDPVDSTGKDIQVEYKLLAAPEIYEKNLKLCLDYAGLKVRKIIVDTLASSELLISDDEKEAGVALLDIGGGTTKIAVYNEGVLVYSSLIPFGGNVVTRDIKLGCSILLRQAEALKVQFGRALGEFAPENGVVTVPGISGWEPKEISFKSLAMIIQARMEEIVEGVFSYMKKSGYIEKMGAGIIITGGGSLLKDVGQLIQFHTGLDVKKGIPIMKLNKKWEKLEDPRNTTVLGLLEIILNEESPVKRQEKKKVTAKKSSPGILTHVRDQVTQQVLTFFSDGNDTEIN